MAGDVGILLCGGTVVVCSWMMVPIVTGAWHYIGLSP